MKNCKKCIWYDICHDEDINDCEYYLAKNEKEDIKYYNNIIKENYEIYESDILKELDSE